MKIKKIILLILSLTIFSCASRKSIDYIQGSENKEFNVEKYEVLLQPDDILVIIVTAKQPDLAKNFNKLYLNAASNESRNINTVEPLYTYLINQEGEITFPVLGKIKLAGLTRIEAENKITVLLEDYIKAPSVTIRVTNFKVSVVGEVSRPGPISVKGDRITLLEAISAAGDLTIYGKRTDILVIREEKDVQTITNIDITKPDFISSPFYYLNHNDVVYVRPNKTKVNSSVIGPNLTVAISALSLLVTIIALSTR